MYVVQLIVPGIKLCSRNKHQKQPKMQKPEHQTFKRGGEMGGVKPDPLFFSQPNLELLITDQSTKSLTSHCAQLKSRFTLVSIPFENKLIGHFMNVQKRTLCYLQGKCRHPLM